MLKKLFVATAAAAAVSVPLAGVAWADKPDNPGANAAEGAPGKGGVPQKVGTFLSGIPNGMSGVPANPNGVDAPVAPGEVFRQAAKTPCAGANCSTPDGYGTALDAFWADRNIATNFGPTIPGSATKLFTPGCGHGNGPVPADSLGNVPVGCVP